MVSREEVMSTTVPLEYTKHGLMVRHSVEVIPGKGRGLVARQFIPKGSLIWSRYAPGYEPIHFTSREEFDKFIVGKSDEEIGFILNHSWCEKLDGRVWYDNGANDQYFNHSEVENNCITVGWDVVANRDIEYGEELVDDYVQYGEVFPWWTELCQHYGVQSCHDCVEFVRELDEKKRQKRNIIQIVCFGFGVVVASSLFYRSTMRKSVSNTNQ